MNNLNFTGNLGKDAEQKYTAGGDSIVSFSVACKAGFGDKATTTWVRCTMFGKRGDAVLKFLNKGQLVGVSGEFSAREWDDKEGQKRTSIECRVNDLTLLGGKQDSQPAQQQAPQRSAQGSPPSKDDLGDDIPFAKRKDY